jgi:TRAP-type uncharacterized transport system substrate-binding protein
MMASSDLDTALSLRRRKRRISALLVLAAGLLLFAAAAGGLYWALRPVTLKIAVGPPGSDDQKLIQALAQTFSRDQSSVRLAPITTEGAAESIAMLAAGKADLAVARGDLDMPADAESVAILRKNVVVLWAPSGLPAKGSKKSQPAKIKSIDDLAGQIAELAKDPAIDAFMAVGPLDSKITTDAIAATARARGEPKFLPIDVSEAIAQKHPLYESEEIAGSTFNSSPARPEDKIETVSVNHLIVARKSLPDTAVGGFVRQLFTVRQVLAREVPGASKIEKPDTDKDAALPAHQGAAAYIDGTERTFLEKYSDYIWGAILVLSGLGSGGAWLRHYWQRDEREQYTLHRDHLLDLISKVRQADSPEQLTQMQGEADGVLRETLNCYDDEAIEEGDLSAIGLVLEQFHHAVADRRAAIGATAPDLPRMRAR